MKFSIMLHFIWVFTVCKSPHYEFPKCKENNVEFNDLFDYHQKHFCECFGRLKNNIQYLISLFHTVVHIASERIHSAKVFYLLYNRTTFWEIFMNFCHLLIFSKSTFSKYSSRNIIRVSNSFGFRSGPMFSWTWSGLNYLQRLSADDNRRHRVIRCT